MAKSWAKLDNAAKIFPSNTTQRDTKVFRVACELHEAVDPDCLQTALSTTLTTFPLYLSVLKRGLFWYYLEASSLPAQVLPERRPPCAPLYDGGRHLLFEVSYFQRRINLEVHHALSDGTGAMNFLRTLVFHYLKTKYTQALRGIAEPDYDASLTQRREDSFDKYYDPHHTYRHKAVHAYRLRGAYLPENRLRVIEGVLSVKEALAAAKAHGVTLTVYLTAQLVMAIHQEMPLRHRNRPIVITVPVNLRKYFSSATARNFFVAVNVSCHLEEGATLCDTIIQVKKSFADMITPENISGLMNHFTSMENNWLARFAPLSLKDVVLRAAGQSARREITAALSNLGVVDMPSACHPYIHRFSVLCATPDLQLCLCSFGDVLTAGVTSPFVSTEVTRRFFRHLAADGMSVGVLSNIISGEESHEKLS